MLTTIDNPYNPYKDFDKWNDWDCRHQYNTCAYLARIVGAYNPELPQDEVDQLINEATLEIVALDYAGLYTIIKENDETPIDKSAYEKEMNIFISKND